MHLRKPRQKKELRDRFIDDTQKLVDTNLRQSDRFVNSAAKYSLELKKAKKFSRASEIEELIALVFEEKMKKMHDASFKIRYAVSINIWLKRASESAKQAGQLQRSNSLEKKAKTFSEKKIGE